MAQQKKDPRKKKPETSCEICGNYVWDDEEGYYTCEADLDEDEMAHFILNRHFECPYYVTDNEYEIVKHHM